MDYTNIAVAILAGLILPSMLKLFASSKKDRLDRLKVLAELEKLQPDAGAELEKLISAEISAEAKGRESKSGLTVFFVWASLGFALSYTVLIVQNWLIASGYTSGPIADADLGSAISMTIFIAGILGGIGHLIKKGPNK